MGGFTNEDGSPTTDPWTPKQDPPAPATTPATPATPPVDTSFHLDKKNWNLQGGSVGDANSGWFIGGIGEQGMRWRTGGGGFEGDIHEKGLDSKLQLGGDLLHASADFKKSTGDLTLQNSLGGQLFDIYGSDKGIGIKNDYNLGGGTFTPSLEHGLTNGGSEVGKLGWKDGSATLGASGTLFDSGGFGTGLSASSKTGTQGWNANADLTSKPDASGLKLGFSQTDGDTTVARNTNLTFGDKAQADNLLKYSDKTDSLGFSQSSGVGGDRTGVDWTHGFAGGSSLTTGFGTGHTATGGLFDDFKLGGSTPLGNGVTGNANLGMKLADSGQNTFDFGAGLSAANDKLNLSGHEGGPLDRSLKLGYDHTVGAGTTFGTSLGFSQNKDGEKVELGQSYMSPGLAEKLSLAATDGPHGEGLTGSGAMEAKLGQDWYAGAFGQGSMGGGKDRSWSAGGSLTYTPTDWLGLTAAAGGGSGGLEARLQADIFQGKPKGADDMMKRQQKPFMSAFIDASTGSGAGLADHFGKGHWDGNLGNGGGAQFQAGVGWNF